MQYVIDSSVFVAAFREEERYAREAFRILKNIEAGRISVLVPVSVLLEVVAAIRRRTGKVNLAREIGQKLVSFASMSFIDITTFRMVDYLDLAHSSGLRGMDVLVVGVAKEFGAALVTLDKDMAKSAKKYVRVVNVKAVR